MDFALVWRPVMEGWLQLDLCSSRLVLRFWQAVNSLSRQSSAVLSRTTSQTSQAGMRFFTLGISYSPDPPNAHTTRFTQFPLHSTLLHLILPTSYPEQEQNKSFIHTHLWNDLRVRIGNYTVQCIFSFSASGLNAFFGCTDFCWA